MKMSAHLKSTSRPLRLAALFALPALAWSFAAPCAGLPDTLQIHGFASQGFTLTSDNNFFGDSDDNASFDYRELGINASLRPLPNLQLSAQLLSRTAGESDNGDIRLDYGFADYGFISSETSRLGLRLGRLKNPLGLYNDTRDVAFTKPSILLPQSIYFDRTRDLALSADGIQLYGERLTDSGDVSFQFGVVEPRVDDDETELVFLGRNLPGDLEDDTSFIGRVLYERDGGRLRLGLSAAEVNIDYDPAALFPNDLLPGSIRFRPWIFSAQYNAERWSLTGEYALRQVRYQDLGGIPDRDFTGESYYVQGTYRFNPKWEGIARYDVLFSNKDDRDGSEFSVLTGRPGHNLFAKDFTVGLGWTITPSLMLRAEYHRVDGTAWLPIPDNLDLADTERRWDLFIMQASFQF